MTVAKKEQCDAESTLMLGRHSPAGFFQTLLRLAG
jgi:hypothetical protein